jgi:hypothetical protein
MMASAFRTLNRSSDLATKSHAVEMPVLGRGLRREAEGAAREDGMIDPDPSVPSAYQDRLWDDCERMIYADLDDRQRSFEELLAAQHQNRIEHAEANRLRTSAGERLPTLESALAQLERPLWIGRIRDRTKWALLLALGLFEWWLIRVALEPLAVRNVVKDLVAALVGIVPIIAIELHGSDVVGFFRWHKNNLEARRVWRVNAAAVTLVLGAVILFIFVMAFVRGLGFGLATTGAVTNLPRNYIVVLAVALALLQLLATAAAFALTRHHAAGDSWRKSNREFELCDNDIETLSADMEQLDDEYPDQLAQHQGFARRAEYHHRVILNAFAARDASYRRVLDQIRPNLASAYAAVWPERARLLLSRLDPVYDTLGPRDRPPSGLFVETPDLSRDETSSGKPPSEGSTADAESARVETEAEVQQSTEPVRETAESDARTQNPPGGTERPSEDDASPSDAPPTA